MDETLAVWALRNARLHAPETSHRLQTRVSSADLGYEHVHRAQVGRWESGKVAVTYERVRRYEDLLGYPEGTLQCTIDALHRAAQPVRSVPLLAPTHPVDVRATTILLERALDNAPMTGLDWYDLSGDLGRMPTAILRRRDWQALFERCLLEMAVSLDLEYALREEALARLAGHPQSGPVIADMAGTVLRDPHTQVYNDTASLLMHCDHPEAAAVLLTILRAPTNNDALRATLIGLTAVARTSTDRDVLGASARHALAYVRDENRPLRVRRQAANLLRVLNLPGKHRLAVGLHAHDLRYAATILLEGRALERKRLHAMAAGIRQALAGSGSGHIDPILDRMIRTALEDTDDAARSAASRVLMLVPQRGVIAAELARELAASRAGEDWLGVQECLEILTSLAQPEDMGEVLDLLVAPDTPPDIAMLSGIVLGNARDHHAIRRELRHQAIVERAQVVISNPLAELEQTPPTTGAADLGRCAEDVRQVLRGLVYVLGIHGRQDLVARLAEHAAAVRAAAPHGAGVGRTGLTSTMRPEVAAEVADGICRWWLELPAHIQPPLAKRA